jgi:DNA-binding LacI/PurR family transcriptional regulator
LAIGAIEAVRELGLKVPDDVSVVGVDDIFASSITTPPLTTLAKPKYERGVQAARLLLERMQSAAPGHPRTVLIASELKVRGSTGPPRQEG